MKQLDSFHGALLINKSAGMTSFDVIRSLQRILQNRFELKRSELPKIGHGGTLDPFATGLLVVCLGEGVKLTRYFLGSSKRYRALVRFGQSTASGDPESEVIGRTDVTPESAIQIVEALKTFTKKPYLQTPPMHSALKKDGKPLYELARKGIEVEREPRECRIWDTEVESYETSGLSADAQARAWISLNCTGGTYIRTLAQDLATSMGSLAMLEKLERTQSSHFELSQALTLEQIQIRLAEGCTMADLRNWISVDLMLEHFPKIEIDEAEALLLRQGNQNGLGIILKTRLKADQASSDCLAMFSQKRLVAVARKSPPRRGTMPS